MHKAMRFGSRLPGWGVSMGSSQMSVWTVFPVSHSCRGGTWATWRPVQFFCRGPFFSRRSNAGIARRLTLTVFTLPAVATLRGPLPY